VELKSTGPHQLLAYADDADLQGDNINAIKNREALRVAGKEVGLEADITEYQRHQGAGQNYNINKASGSFETVVQFKHFGNTVTNQHRIHEEIKSNLKWAMLATVQDKIIYLLACCLKTIRSQYKNCSHACSLVLV
jgi:hypothetical protein